MNNASLRPLDGIRVLDLTVALSGPYATMVLGGMGAEVIRVEAPGGSDISRNNPPIATKDGLRFGENTENDLNLTTLGRARNKKSITLDLKSTRGRELLMQLAKECDVFVENMSEGATARLKVDYEEVRKANPRIIYASLKAMGEPSAWPTLKGMDIIVQALSGIMETTGPADGPPIRCGLPIGDMLAPQYLLQGILAALIYRGRTGEGQHVKVSMLDCLASWVAVEHFDVLGGQGYPVRSGNFLDRLIPFGVYQARNGYVAIVAFQGDWFKGLLEAIGRPELENDPRYSTRVERMNRAAEFNDIIQAWTRLHNCDDIVHALLDQRGVPCAKVRTPDEVLADPHLHASGALTRLAHPRYGDVNAVGCGLPIQFSASTAQFDQPTMELGTSNDDIYRGLLNLSPGEMSDLRSARVI
ncbi:MAG: CoA transferase [Pseudomonadota bacterium]